MLPWRATSRPLPFRPLGQPGRPWDARPAAHVALRDPNPRGAPTSPTTGSPLLPLLGDDPVPGSPQSPPSVTPPKRPTTSSWQPAVAPVARGTPSHAVIEMLDLELEEPPTCNKDETRQMANAVGAGELYDAYRARFAAGAAPVDQLPELLAAAGLTASLAQVEAAVAALWPQGSAAGGLPYEHCRQLFLHLQQQQRKAGEKEEGEAPQGRLARWWATLSDRGAANLLLVGVITCTIIGYLFLGGLAILLMFLDDTDTVKSRLQETLGVVEDSLDVYGTQIAAKETSDRATLFVATMASILQSVAFATTVSANAAQLSRVLVSISNGYAAWLTYPPAPAAVGLAAMTARLVNASAAQYGRSTTGALVDEVNAGLPGGMQLLLGQWRANSTSAVQYLTQLPNASQCAANPCAVSAAATAPMRAALAGNTSATWTVDYRGEAVYAGYSSANGLGVQVDLLNTTLFFMRLQEAQAYLDAWTADPTNSWEYMLGYMPSPGVRVMTSTLPGCDAACQAGIVADGMPLARALNGETGTTTYINFRGVKSVVSYAPIPNAPIPMGLAIHNAYSDILVTVLTAATALVNNINTKFPYHSEEFELVQFETEGNATNFSHLSAYKFRDECPDGQCMPAPEYVQQATANCSLAVTFSSHATDYRGKAVLVGSTCSEDLGVVLSFKMDQDDLDNRTLTAVIEAVGNFNAAGSEDSTEFLVAKPKAGLTAAQVTGYGDFDVVSQPKYPNQCAASNCTCNRESALRALQDLQAVIDTRDCRNVDVLAASSRSAAVSYGLGVAVEQGHSDAFQPTVDTIIKLAAFTWGMVLAGTLTQAAIMRYYLRAMIRAREEGQQALVAERERFRTLVASMYPQYVVPQLLAGQKQMVCEVPGAAVFFSDIHEFTSASNTMGSSELLQLMGYVYGVMDRIADRFGVYKVKTIGDAYLAVRGLPGSTSENPSLDLLRYASCVCQVFGDRFVHPTEGQVLAAMNKAMMWNGPVGGWKRGSRSQKDKDGAESVARSVKSVPRSAEAPSVAPPKVPPSHRSKHSQRTSTAASSRAGAGEGQVQCVMTYGLAVGRIVAGVLGGRAPMFDIWGATVNLASRMQNTGEPGRIQVSEQLYKKVIAVPGQPFTFDLPRSTVCKGFGSVNAYLVRGTSEGLPKDLQEQLRLEPRYGAFLFDNILTSVPQGVSEWGLSALHRGNAIPSAFMQPESRDE